MSVWLSMCFFVCMYVHGRWSSLHAYTDQVWFMWPWPHPLVQFTFSWLVLTMTHPRISLKCLSSSMSQYCNTETVFFQYSPPGWRGVLKKLFLWFCVTVLCTIMMVHKCKNCSYLWSLILLGLALCLPSASVSLVFMVLYTRIDI